MLGAGPAGLTAAYTLSRLDRQAAVYEAGDIVGGLARTVEHNGYRFDLGGHRFFTKLRPVERLWEELLGEEFLIRPRLSRIFYRGGFFAYPITASDTVRRLGLIETVRCGLSYLASRARDRGQHPETFEDWVTTRFGRRLYDAFFRSYTEKVWGIPGSEIRSEWAAQRIRNFSLSMAVKNMLRIRRTHVTTLIEEFRYPRLGPGQMWESFAAAVSDAGIPVHLGHRCVTVRHADGRATAIVLETPDGARAEVPVDGLLSSIPLSELVLSLDPPAPDHVLEAARQLRYRAFRVVALVSTAPAPFPDTWIYLHDPGTRAGRVQNFGAWSDAMVKPGTSCLGVEYFCFPGDEIWEMDDDAIIELATAELARIGLIDPTSVVDGASVRVPNAYPMYDGAYRDALAVVRPYVESFANLATFGRNGLHRYNNQDHSMWTAILATLNLVGGASYDVWSVNTEAEYHEETDGVERALDAEVSAAMLAGRGGLR